VVIFRNGMAPQMEVTARLNPHQLLGVCLIHERGNISSPAYAEATGAAARTALYDLREMVDRGILTSRGKKRAVPYYLR
jgi:Fic family protein